MQDDRPKSLIVIGAGMAGIKLSHFLLQHDPDMSITILEANNYVGGRVRFREFQNHAVEMGANWISGMETTYQNPIWELAKNISLGGHFVDRTEERAALVVDAQGNNVQQEYLEAVDRFDECYEKAVNACAERKIKGGNDVNVRSLLEEFGWPPQDNLSTVERLVEYNILEVWGANSLSELSAAYNLEPGANDVDLGKDEFFVEDSRGFNCIMNGMVKDIQEKGGIIQLETKVQRVEYTPDNVRVTAKCESSVKEYTADAVVCTVSVGVLQSKKIEFSPPFPEWKTRALHEIDMFLFSKVYAKFDHEFWSTTKNQIIVASEKKGHYPLWMRYRRAKHSNLFMCYLGGSEARRVETLSEEEIKNEIEQHFTSAFGSMVDQVKDSTVIFRPSAVAVTDWSMNPHFCGSYSLFPVGAFSRVPIENLTRGLTGTEGNERRTTLYFAGEAFDDKFNGWVQGAYLSGERVAKQILGLSEE